MESDKRVMYGELIRWTQKLLESAGFNNDQTDTFAQALVWSDLIGRSTHGIWRLPAYMAQLESGVIKCPCIPTLSSNRQSVAIIDGDRGLGHFIGHKAMSCAIGKARASGLGAVGVHNSNHFGAGAYFVHQAAELNMIGLAVSNSIAKVAAYGGTNPVFGTNPFAFGVPRRNGEHMLLDMSTSAICGSDATEFAESGTPLPKGIAVDNKGNSITDANELANGALLPFGGAKGYGLALMIEILTSVLTGAAFSTHVNSMFRNFGDTGKNGHFFIAIDLGQMINPDKFSDRVEELFMQISRSGLNEGDVLIPGEMRWVQYRENIINGIALAPSTLSALEIVAQRHGLALFEQSPTN